MGGEISKETSSSHVGVSTKIREVHLYLVHDETSLSKALISSIQGEIVHHNNNSMDTSNDSLIYKLTCLSMESSAHTLDNVLQDANDSKRAGTLVVALYVPHTIVDLEYDRGCDKVIGVSYVSDTSTKVAIYLPNGALHEVVDNTEQAAISIMKDIRTMNDS